MIELSLLDSFPRELGEPRDKQVEILKGMEEAIDNGMRYLVLKAGVGIGKSAIAITLARELEEAYIVTGTKDLQKQYYRDFHYPTLFGRGNFMCNELYETTGSEQFMCDEGFCRDAKNSFKCPYGVTMAHPEILMPPVAFEARNGTWYWRRHEEYCKYWEQKAEVINEPISLLNYTSFFLEMNYVPMMHHKKLVVFDEAQKLEDELMSQMSHKISNYMLDLAFKPFFDISTPEFSVDEYADQSGSSGCISRWIDRLYNLQEYYERAIESKEFEELSKRDAERLATHIRKIENIIWELKKNPSNWVFSTPNRRNKMTGFDEPDKEAIQFQPVWISPYTKSKMTKFASKLVLMMSATLPPKNKLAKWYGIPYDEIYYQEVESDFPLANRKIAILNYGRMTYNSYQGTFRKVIPAINDLLEVYKDKKGVIHTHSNKFTKILLDGITDKSRLMYYTGSDEKREDVIKAFKKIDEPKVLIAPGVKEGVDLKGDQCRFQILLKVPYPPWGDKQIKARKLSDPDWYNYKTVNDIEQSYGRGIRSYDDQCDTYIVDGSIFHVVKSPQMRKFASEYFKMALDSAKTVEI